jgi:protein TonB
MTLRLIPALALSLALHLGLFLPDLVKRLAIAPLPPPMLATLRLPPKPEVSPVDSLLKNTIDEETAKIEKPLPPPRAEKPKTSALSITRREIQAAQRKLSKYIFYPEEARQQGLEGTLQLYVELSDDGSVEDVRVVFSSGHAILDNAAIKGFYAVGKLPGKSDQWNYTFRLE